jgi:uncharacterized protein (TIGR00725 family)
VPDSASRLAVIGGASCSDRQRGLALRTGRAIARAGAVLLCGGGGGVMRAAAEGASSEGGLTVGILPGSSRFESPPNEHIRLPIYTGMGQARNQILVLSADAAIAIAGGWGTLTEIGLARKHDIPVVLLDSWRLERPDGRPDPGLMRAEEPEQAAAMALAAAASRRPG